jgi:hypothetical protein
VVAGEVDHRAAAEEEAEGLRFEPELLRLPLLGGEGWGEGNGGIWERNKKKASSPGGDEAFLYSGTSQ